MNTLRRVSVECDSGPRGHGSRLGLRNSEREVGKERGRLSRGRGRDAEVDFFGRKECANALIEVLRPVAVPQDSRVPPGGEIMSIFLKARSNSR